MLRDLILEIREQLLSTEDTVCLERARLVTEAYERYAGDPVPLKRARAFAHVLRSMTLDLDTNPVFAGNTSTKPRAWMLLPEYGFRAGPQIVHENTCLRGILDGAIPEDLLDFWKDKSFGGGSGIGHLAVDLHRVVHEGLEAMITEAQGYADEDVALQNGDDRQRYREAMVVALQAVIDWANRYARAAEVAAQATDDPLLRACHLRVADACRRVPGKPARTLFEGLQAMVLVHLAIHIEGHGLSVSIGLPDRILAPFIDDTLDPDAATNLLAAFLLKINANSLFGRGSKTQAITLGGLDHRGEDQCNAITRAFLDACDLVRVGDPHLFLRWHTCINPEIKRRAIDMLASGVSMPLLIHDVPTAQGFINAGVTEEDAWDYCVIGCNELGIPGRSAESATATSGLVQYLELLNQTLLEHPDPDAIDSMTQLLAALEEKMMTRALTSRERGLVHRQRAAEQTPTPFTSALMRGCIGRGLDMRVGMVYHLPGIYERGLSNAVNALAAIEQLVFERHALTMSALVQALRENFVGADALRAQLLRGPKWGNDDPRADHWAATLLAMRERVMNAVDARFGHSTHMVCHVVRSLHYFDGKRIAASPDGRLAWTPVADSIGAQVGTAAVGPTAILDSVLKIDAATYYRGGYNLNLTLPSSQWRHPEMQANLLALVEAFFAQGGQELQIGCLDSGVLREAQLHPERYGDLLVRVAGFNARFVDLSEVEQEELIQRAEAVV